MRTLTVKITEPVSGPILVPTGISTPYESVTTLGVNGSTLTQALTEPELALGACVIAPAEGTLTLEYTVEEKSAQQPYPETAFRPRHNRFTDAAQELAEASADVANRAGGGRAGIEALVAEAEARFTYAHPDHRFYDGLDKVPYLTCGTTPGSCVDINTYLVASLRAAGYDAAYLYGYFFPEERGGVTHDMHCWVVTRHEGEILEWDIAHHMKAGLGPTCAGLNPRPGERVALGHSMGHTYRCGDKDVFLKLLASPLEILPTGEARYVETHIQIGSA